MEELNTGTTISPEVTTDNYASDTTEIGTEDTTQSTEPVIEQPKIKVKFNHEEKELSYDEAVQLAQKGMNYDKQVERLKQLETDPRLSFVEEMANAYGMSPQQYIEAVKEAQEQERLNQLIEQNIPEEYAREMLESRKFREQFESEKRHKEQEERQMREYQDFFETFPNVKVEDISQETWLKVNQGVPLKYAYMEHENSILKREKNAQEVNAKNAETSTGSVTGNGKSINEYISAEEFQAKKSDRNWVIKNLSKISASRSKW
jgi:hypothetical protein